MNSNKYEIEQLRETLRRMEEEQSRHTANVIVAEIALFLLGIFIGAAFMYSYGWKPL